MVSDRIIDIQYVKSRLLALIDNLSDESLLLLLKHAEELPLKGNRKDLRKVCLIRIDIITPDTQVKGTAHDISYSGIFVETGSTVPVGWEISLVISGPCMLEPIEIKGEIKRMAPRGMGVQFKDLSEDQEKVIKNLVDSI